MDRANRGAQDLLDSDLLSRVFSEVPGGWEEFWSHHGPYIERIVGRFRLGDHQEDVVQEIAQTLIQNEYKKLKDWDLKRSSLRRYLTIVSVSSTLNYVKSSKYRFNLLKSDSIDSATGASESIGQFVDEVAISPMDRLERIQTMELLQEVLCEWVETEKIKPMDREIIEYRLRGLTFREISEVMEVSVSHITTRFARLKPKLRKKLENAGIVR